MPFCRGLMWSFRFGGGGNFRQNRQLRPVNQFQNIQSSDNSCGEKSRACDASSKFRTISGHCNNIDHPEFGQSDRVFTRFVAPVYDDGNKWHALYFRQPTGPLLCRNRRTTRKQCYGRCLTACSSCQNKCTDRCRSSTSEIHRTLIKEIYVLLMVNFRGCVGIARTFEGASDINNAAKYNNKSADKFFRRKSLTS